VGVDSSRQPPRRRGGPTLPMNAEARTLSHAIGAALRAGKAVRVSETQVALPAAAFFDRWPACRNAVQPRDDAPAGSTYVAAWKRDHAKGWRLRSPATSPDGLVGPFLGRGGCLEPYFHDGDFSYTDPRIAPEHGDFVALMWSPGFFERLVRTSADEFIRETGRSPSGFAVKRLLRVGREWCLATVGPRGTTATVPLAGNARLLGVVTYVERGGRAALPVLPASMIRLDRVWNTEVIAPNAVTDPVVSSTGIGTIGGPAGSYDSTIRTASLANTTGSVITVQVEVSIQNVGVSWDTAPPATRRVYYTYSSSSSGSGSADMLNPAPEVLGDVPASATAVIQVPLLNGDTLTVNLKGNVAHTDDVFLFWSAATVRMVGLQR